MSRAESRAKRRQRRETVAAATEANAGKRAARQARKTRDDSADLQLQDDLWFIKKSLARGEINASEYAALQNEAYAKQSGSQP